MKNPPPFIYSKINESFIPVLIFTMILAGHITSEPPLLFIHPLSPSPLPPINVNTFQLPLEFFVCFSNIAE